MSCMKNSQAVTLGSRVAGVPMQASAQAYQRAMVAGAALGRVGGRARDKLEEGAYAVAQKTAPVSNKVLAGINTVERYGGEKLLTGLVGRALVKTLGRRAIAPALRLTGLARKATTVAGSAAGDLSRKSLAATVVQERRQWLFFKRKVAVGVWNSHLTPLLNRTNRLGVGEKVRSQSGAMVKVDGATWHRGTSVLEMPGGQERTVTHLQSLSYPARHFYFDRPLSARETAGIVAGEKEYQPQRLAGYIGQVSEVESLCPGWASAKQNMIKARMLFPGDRPAGQTPPPRPRSVRPATERDADRLADAVDQARQRAKKKIDAEVKE